MLVYAGFVAEHVLVGSTCLQNLRHRGDRPHATHALSALIIALKARLTGRAPLRSHVRACIQCYTGKYENKEECLLLCSGFIPVYHAIGGLSFCEQTTLKTVSWIVAECALLQGLMANCRVSVRR